MIFSLFHYLSQGLKTNYYREKGITNTVKTEVFKILLCQLTAFCVLYQLEHFRRECW